MSFDDVVNDAMAHRISILNLVCMVILTTFHSSRLMQNYFLFLFLENVDSLYNVTT